MGGALQLIWGWDRHEVGGHSPQASVQDQGSLTVWKEAEIGGSCPRYGPLLWVTWDKTLAPLHLSFPTE